MAEKNAGNIGEDLKIVTKRQSCSDGDGKNDGIVSTSRSHSQFKRSKPNDEADLKSDTKGLTSSGDTVMDDSTPPIVEKIDDETSVEKIDDETRVIERSVLLDWLHQWRIIQKVKRIDDMKRLMKSDPLDLLHQWRFMQSFSLVEGQFMSAFIEMTKSPIMKCESLTPNEIKKLVKETIQKLDNWSHLAWTIHGSGSNYSKGEEIKTRSDYDYLLFPTNVPCRIEQCLDHPCYCRVFITDRRKMPLGFQELLEENDQLYPSKFKDSVFPLLSQIVKQDQQLERVENKCTSPAFTIRQVCESKMLNKIDWVPALKIREPPDFCMQWKTRMLTEDERNFFPICMVPKTLPGNESLWRISFSHFEKEILSKCHPLQSKVLQYLKFQLKELKVFENTKKKEDWKLSSYPITINCMHFFERHPVKKHDIFPSYLQRVRNYLIEALERKNIPHFFIENVNLLEEVDDEECRLFIEKLRHQQD